MKIRIIPNILSREGRSEFIPEWKRGKTVREYLRDRKIKTKGMRVIVSGKAIKKLSVPVKRDDEIVVTPIIKDPFSIVFAIGWALTASLTASLPLATMITVATITGWAVIGAVVGIATLAIISAFSGPRKPSYGGTAATGGLDASSPTYGWDGVQTQQNVGTAIGVVYGEHKIGGNVINQFITNDGDKNYLHSLIALCEGEIEAIADIQVNDNPIANFEGITTAQKLGTNAQVPITGFEDLHDINNVAITMNDLNDNHVYTMSGDDIVGFEVLVTFPSGLYYMSNSGAISSAECQVKIEYKLHAAGTYTLLDTFIITESNRSSVRRIFRKIGLAAGKYDIKVTRMTAAGDVNTVRDMVWTHADELRDDSLAYPNTALLALNYLATDQLSGGMPNVTCVVKGKKVSVPNILTEEDGDPVDYDDYYYDPTASEWKLFADDSTLYWDGTTYVTAYSANPVWVINDIFTSKRYGLGEFIDTMHISLASFIEMAKYCDGKVADGDGGFEKRFRLDVVLDSETRAIDALMQLASTFRAIFYFSENAIQLKIDKPELPVQMFTMGNIIQGSFLQKWKSVKDVPNVMQVQFLDKDKNYEQEIISFMDETALAAGEPLRKKDLRLFCTRVSQVIREARYLLYFSKYVDRSISFKAGIDALACQVGDVIDFAHDVPQWGYSGRIVAYDGDTKEITFDRDVTIVSGKTYVLRIRHSDDTLEDQEVSNSAGVTNKITVSTDFSFTPAAYDVCSFGEENIAVKSFRIMSLQREKNNEVQITAVEYNETVFDDTAPVLPTSNYSALDLDVGDVENLALTEGVIVSGGVGSQTVDVWFTKPDDSGRNIEFRWAGAKIYYSSDDRVSWRLAGIATDSGFQILGVEPNTEYYVAAVSMAKNGMQNDINDSPQNSITTTAGAAVTPPITISGLAGVFTGDMLELAWTPLAIVPQGYEIRLADSNWGTANSDQLFQGVVNKFSFKPSAYSGITYYVKAFNSGGYATTAATVTPAKDLPATVTGLAGAWTGNNLTLSWTALGIAPDFYEVRTADSNWGTVNAALIYQGSQNSLTFLPADHSGITYYVKGYNKRGYTATAASVAPSKPVPADVSGLASSWDGRVVSLKWTALAEAPNAYEIRTEDDHWGTVDSKQIYVGSGNVFAFEPAAFSGVTYYIKAVNWAGYSETAGSTAPDMPTPADVTGFGNVFENNLIKLSWSPNATTPLQYEVRTADSNWGTVNSALVYQGLSTSITIEATVRSGVTYYVRAMSASFEYSANAASTAPANAAPGAITGLGHDLLFNVARFFWTNSSDTDIQKYQVYKSETNAWGGEEVLLGEARGIQMDVLSKTPRSSLVTTVTSKTVIRASALIGLDDDYFNGDQIMFLSGDNANLSFTIDDFDGTDGIITLSEAAPSDFVISDRFIINDIFYLKVRGVDTFGPGTLSSAHQIIFESLSEDMFGDNVISARKINVACLSAISANLGSMTAGTITGATVQTGSGGQRLVLDSGGLYGYDASCCQKLQICTDGTIVAQSAKFQDPACSCNYSYITAGALQFHDACGDVPYIKRIASGVIASGGIVCLPGWKTEPKVMVGINSLYSYNSTYNGQCQAWDVYACNPVCYSGGGQYGYCFEVHALLRLSKGVGTPTAVDAAWDACFNTEQCVCATTIVSNLLYYCNAIAPGNYYYGTLCYAVCYRVQGSGTWCACCFTYTQPHGARADVTTTAQNCAAMTFPCIACWQIMLHKVSVCWTDSGFNSGTQVCCSWAGSVACVAWACCCCRPPGYPGSVSFCCTVCADFGAAPAADCNIFYSCLCYKINSKTKTADYQDWGYGMAWVCLGVWDANSPSCFMCGCCCYTRDGVTLCQQFANCGVTYATGCHGFFPFCFRLGGCVPNPGDQTNYVMICAGCLTCVCQIICYYAYTGAAACCMACCVCCRTDTYGCYCVLDAAGQLNWLAIAYT